MVQLFQGKFMRLLFLWPVGSLVLWR